MKKHLAGTAVAVIFAAITLASATPSLAQESGPMKVKVPFSFMVENDRMPAGDYTIQRIVNGHLRLQSKDGRVSLTVIGLPAQGKSAPDKAHFIFHCYAGNCFLANIWTPGLDVGWQLLAGKYEQELARNKTAPLETATVVGQ
ncbi:MAG: hypothetical protein ACLQLC_06800 [Candidatus Sulfotelmatobacter sp.]